jgi:hypothetical protein
MLFLLTMLELAMLTAVVWRSWEHEQNYTVCGRNYHEVSSFRINLLAPAEWGFGSTESGYTSGDPFGMGSAIAPSGSHERSRVRRLGFLKVIDRTRTTVWSAHLDR